MQAGGSGLCGVADVAVEIAKRRCRGEMRVGDAETCQLEDAFE